MAKRKRTRNPGVLDGLNKEQRRAVRHGDSPLLVVAGAGTGKTMADADPRITCASRQVWNHVRQAGCELDHLLGLIELVHDGDNWDHTSSAWQQSKRTGLHVQIRTFRNMKAGDAEICGAIHAWLSACYRHSE